MTGSKKNARKWALVFILVILAGSTICFVFAMYKMAPIILMGDSQYRMKYEDKNDQN